MTRADNTLTTQEIQAAHRAVHDLGPGYPLMRLPDYVRDACLDANVGELGLIVPPHWTPSKQAMVNADLEEACRRMLTLPADSYDTLSVTFSGSVALDRTLVAALDMSSDRGRHARIGVVTTTPSIDIMRLFLQEKRQVITSFAPSRNGGLGRLDRDEVLRRIADVRNVDGAGLVVLLTSPENPTGAVWPPEDLEAIGEACFAAGGTLVLDHTFVTAGVHDRSDVRCIWQVLGRGRDWIAVWDTGKTFGLNEDKLGFIITGSGRATTFVRRTLGVLQFDVPRRQKILFAAIMRRSSLMDYTRHLNRVCLQNLDQAVQLSQGSDLVIRRPDAGSMLLLDLPPGAPNDEQTRLTLLEAGVGVIAGNVFFHSRWRPRNMLRVALARDPDYFARAFTTLVECVHR